MRYWDSSALIPLVVAEPTTKQARTWLREDPQVVTWCWSWVEIASAVERRARHGEISADQRRETLRRFQDLGRRCSEVVDVVAARKLATALLARHDIRAADAAQLAAALLVAENDPASLEFVCFDAGLRDAAEREGLTALF